MLGLALSLVAREPPPRIAGPASNGLRVSTTLGLGTAAGRVSVSGAGLTVAPVLGKPTLATRASVAGTGLAVATTLGKPTVSSGSSYDTDAQAAFTAMTVQPDTTRKGHYNTLITSLKSAGVWTKLSSLWVMAAHDAQAARVNLKAPSVVASTVNSPTFTTDRGYTGDGATSYLNLGVSLDAASPYAQNDCHMGVWVGTDVQASSAHDIGTTAAAIASKTSSTGLAIRPQRTTASTVLFTDLGASAVSTGHTMWSRPSSSSVNVNKNGGTFFAVAVPSSALAASVNVFAGARNDAGTPTGFSTRRVQSTHFGSNLTQTEATALYNALSTFMTAVGA